MDKKWQKAISIFWNKVLDINMKEMFQCKNCGVRPEMLVADGVSIGLQLKRLAGKENLFIPFSNKPLIKGPPYKKRMFVKKHKNQMILKEAAETKSWPNFNSCIKNDSGMRKVEIMVSKVKCSDKQPKKALLDLFRELGNKTSTTSLFQVVNEDLLEQLKKYCNGDQSFNFIKGFDGIGLHQELKENYPVITEIVKGLASKKTGMLGKNIGKFIAKLVNHTLNFYRELPERNEKNYETTDHIDVMSEVYPNFDIKYKMPRYEKTCTDEDIKAWSKLCSKSFPSNAALSPGLFILCCPCPKNAYMDTQ